MEKTAAIVPEEQHFLSSLAPGPLQRRLALAVVLVFLVVFFIAAGPLSTTKTAPLPAFLAAYCAAMFVTYLITAILLFAQFSVVPTRPLLVISNGYLFTALTIIPWMLTFPVIFPPSGLLLGTGLRSVSYLYFLWHTVFPTSIIAYALLKDGDPTKRLWQGSVRVAVLSSIVVTTGIVCAATFLIEAGDRILPPILFQSSSLAGHYAVTTAMLLLCFLALVMLWARGRSLLDMWLMVVMCAWVIEIWLVSFPVTPVRYSVGWYVGRMFGLLSGSLVLISLLYEITTLYARLLRAVSAQRREREARLMTGYTVSASIAHEIKQPLSGMITNADAGLGWLKRTIPDLDKAMASFEYIIHDGQRAGAIIDGVRAIFKKDARDRTSLNINELIVEALALERDELQKHRVSVQAELNEQLPRVRGDRVQMQQVLLNLITNAIDSMAAKQGPRMLCVKSKVHDSEVMVLVEDTGTGVEPKDVDRIFNALFTTKSNGMGMGLSICRSIIEAHNGRLWVKPNTPDGAVFQFMLLADGATSAGASRGEQPDDLSPGLRL
jgi:signal transduction histidine kinase